MIDRAKEVFLDALEEPEARRAEFVAEACGDDAELRARVERLLASHDDASGGLGPDEVVADGNEVLGRVAASALGSLDVAPGDVLGNYRLERVLGEGGYGSVYLAQQERPVQRSVALKLIKLGMDTRELLARFEVERETLARMDHPNIARVLDAGATPNGRPYFVIELVDGEAITEFCESRELALHERVRLVRQVCLAIQHAHTKGVLHRDIKPSNVLVSVVDGEPQSRVIDFGIAKAIGASETDRTAALTAEGLFIGTPEYMSPEQAVGSADIDTRSDVYALGVLLYELVCGEVPFAGKGSGPSALLDLHQRIIHDEPRPPSTRPHRGATSESESVARELDWIVLCCLEKDRERRYPTAIALARDLDRFLADQPVEAAPPSRTYRLRKLLRRHRSAALATAITVLALVAGVVGTTLGLVRASRANARLDVARAQAERDAAEAQRQAGIADAVNAFLTDDLLSAARPSAAASSGPEVRMIEVLDAAAERIDAASQEGERFDGAPLIEARIRRAIGQTYNWLGQYPKALPHLERSHALFVAALGGEDKLTTETAGYVVTALIGVGHFREGEQLADEVLPAMRRVFGERSVGAAELHKLLGLARGGQGQWEGAVAAYRAGLAALPLEPGAREIELKLLSALAIAEVSRGETEEADVLFREVSARYIDYMGPEDPQTLVARANLATFLRSRGELDEARDILVETADILARVSGANHPNTLVTLQSLGGLLRKTGELEEARGVLTRVSAGLTELYGAGHPSALAAARSLALLLADQGELDEAEAILRDSVALAEAGFGPDGHETLVRLESLGEFLFDHGRRHEAQEVLARALDGFARAFGHDDERTRGIEAKLDELARKPVD